MTSIPLIDISPLDNGGARGLAEVAAQIDEACRVTGFFYITGHGVPREQIELIFREAKRLFDLPMAEKRRISITDSDFHRGLGVIGTEALEEGRPGDFKEGYDMARHLPLTHPDVVAGRPLHGPNQYPDLAGWRDVMESHYWLMLRVGLRVLRGVAVALDLPPDFFESRFANTVSVLRLLHYPPHEQREADDQLGCGAHTDYGCITLLAQDAPGGLQVQARDGSWIEATPIPDTFVVNLGDLMPRWTNDRWVSTPHRVINAGGEDRYSIPFFCEPDIDTHVECLPSCLAAGEKAKYPPTTSGDWLLSRFDATYAYRQDDG